MDTVPPAGSGDVDPGRRALLAAGSALALAGWTAPVGSLHASATASAADTARTRRRPGHVDAIATTRSGPIRGYPDGGLHVFKGVPYGADTAPRRFQRALRERPWDGMRGATRAGAPAPQRGDDGPGSEDCLLLNVWTPGLRDGGHRPVLVYLHGGGYDTGSGSAPLYDGARLCRRGDVVVVTVNHRLNAFGYLYLAQHGDADFADSGNVGQLDLVDALHWVRTHAAEFGGNPGNVTVFGQSGGGAKIATLMAMPAARGLFHRAWTMSGQQVTAAGPRAANQRAQLLLDALGIAPDALDRLRTLPAARILDATALRDPSRAEDTRLYFGPVLDTRNLPRHPFWPDAPPQSAAIPMVIGNTRDETRAFLGRDPAHFTLTWDTLPARLQAHQYVDIDPATVIAGYRSLYPAYSPSEVFFAATTAGRSWRGAIEELEARARQDAPTWSYQLDWGSPMEGGRLRALHTLDIALVFDNVDATGSLTGGGDDARRLASAMSGALLAFARTGNPQSSDVPDWPRYSLQRRETLVFDDPSHVVHDPRGGERVLYGTVPFIQRGTL